MLPYVLLMLHLINLFLVCAYTSHVKCVESIIANCTGATVHATLSKVCLDYVIVVTFPSYGILSFCIPDTSFFLSLNLLWHFIYFFFLLSSSPPPPPPPLVSLSLLLFL